MLKGWELQWWQGKINYSYTRHACWKTSSGNQIFTDITIPVPPLESEEPVNIPIKDVENMDVDN